MTLDTPAHATQATALPPAPVVRPVRNIPLAALNFSKINVRRHKDKDVDTLAASIRSVGLLHPIVVRAAKGDTYDIVAGERRTLAVQKLNKENHPDSDAVPAIVLEDGDDALAIAASLAENLERLPMDEMDQFEAFAALHKQGRTIPQIAFAFGCTEQLVKKRLALGNLLPKIRQMFRNEDIGAKELQLLTMATTAKQKAYVKAFETGKDFPQNWQLKEWLLGGNAIKTSAALFDLATYTAPITQDLFGEDTYFSDSDKFWKLQNAAIAALKDTLISSGWAEVHLVEPNQHFYEYDYNPLAKAKGGHVYIVVRASGDVDVKKGFVSDADLKKLQRQAQNTSSDDTDGDAPKADVQDRPELSEPLANYIDLVRHSAVRAELIKTPKLALRLAVAQLVAGSTNWTISAEPRRPANEAIAAALKNTPADKAFNDIRAKAKALLPKLKKTHLGSGEKDAIRQPSHGETVAAILTHLQTLPDGDVLAILAGVTAETLALGTEVVDTLGVAMAVDPAKSWAPDDTFFELTRDKEVLNEMLAEVIGKTAAASYLTGTGKSKKDIIKKALAGENRTKVTGWMPRWMTFPSKAYTKRPLTKIKRSIA